MVGEEETKPLKQSPNYYGQEVLVGSWFERRLAGQIDKKAIAPSITGKSGCVDHKTTYQASYTVNKPPPDPCDDTENAEIIDLRVQAYHNKITGRASLIKMNDGDKFMKNMTTTTDISYRIIPSLVCQSPDSQFAEMPHKNAYYALYGNGTRTGLRAWIACEEKDKKRNDLTVTKTDFVPKPVKRIKLWKSRCG